MINLACMRRGDISWTSFPLLTQLNRQLIVNFVENVHFSRETMNPFHIGYRALAANLSDMAAMGATPTYYLVGAVVPKNWSSGELHGIFKGMRHLADKYAVDLIGGDTVSGSELT